MARKRKQRAKRPMRQYKRVHYELTDLNQVTQNGGGISSLNVMHPDFTAAWGIDCLRNLPNPLSNL